MNKYTGSVAPLILRCETFMYSFMCARRGTGPMPYCYHGSMAMAIQRKQRGSECLTYAEVEEEAEDSE